MEGTRFVDEKDVGKGRPTPTLRHILVQPSFNFISKLRVLPALGRVVTHDNIAKAEEHGCHSNMVNETPYRLQ
jgi:hypothetical protein